MRRLSGAAAASEFGALGDWLDRRGVWLLN